MNHVIEKLHVQKPGKIQNKTFKSVRRIEGSTYRYSERNF